MTESAEVELASLYIPLYFDEDVSADIVNNLLTRGFDVLSARDEGMLRKADDERMPTSQPNCSHFSTQLLPKK